MKTLNINEAAVHLCVCVSAYINSLDNKEVQSTFISYLTVSLIMGTNAEPWCDELTCTDTHTNINTLLMFRFL